MPNKRSDRSWNNEDKAWSALRAKLSPPQIARHLSVGVGKVLGWIRRGELRAVNVAARLGGRPRWRIDLRDLEAFEAARTAAPVPKRTRAKRLGGSVIEFF